MVKRFFLLMAFVGILLPLTAQNNKTLTKLRNQKAQYQKKISKSEKQLQATNLSVKKGLSNLTAINGQIEKQEKTIKDIQVKIDSIGTQMYQLDKELKELNRQLEDKKQKYRRSMIYLYNNRKDQNKLLFILSADNFTQMFRRYRYVREYAKYQRVQGMQIQKKEEQVEEVQKKLQQSKAEQDKALGLQQAEKTKLVGQQAEQQKTVKNLQKQQKQIQNVLATAKKEMAQLNNKIDYYVRLALEQERKRREEEERKRREAERKNESKNSSNLSSKSSKSSSKKSSVAPMPQYRESSKEYKLGQSFASNKGRLPMPVTGAYIISSHYGNYNLNGLSGVRLDNKGINITTKGAASARAVFDGEVSAIFTFAGLYNVIVRHGSYLSMYCNLSGVNIRKGQHVSTRQTIGNIARDVAGNYTLHFQLRKETSILNPESWLAR